MNDARSLARDLLNRRSADAAAAAPAAASSTMINKTPATVINKTPVRGVKRVEDLPQVQASLKLDRLLDGAEQSLGAPSPYYQSHRGFNGAMINLHGQDMINFSSYNYLGLGGHPEMIEASKAAIDEYGTTSGATRIVSGNIPLHEELEAEIAKAYGVEDATTVGSGFLTNASVISFVLSENDMAMCDALVHNSIVAGTLWSGSQRMQFRHNDPESLDAMLSRSRRHFDNVLVILEGVYSMDGDIARLPELIAVARKHDCLVMIDEAHSFAVLGERGLGVRELFDLPSDSVDIWMGTLSKALASHGGFVAGSRDFVQACRMAAPGMSLYAAGPTPATAAAAITAIRLVQSEPERLQRLRRNSELFVKLVRDAGLDAGPSSGTPIVPVILGSSQHAVTVGMMLHKAGVNANPITYPAVSEGEARLRFFLCADHTEDQLRLTVDALAQIVAEHSAA